MSAVKAVRTALVVVTWALLCACGAHVAGSPSNLVTVTDTVKPSSASALSAINRTTALDESGAHPSGASLPATSPAGGVSADVIQVSKCYTNATPTGGGEMLIKARSSDPMARLFAYRPDGTPIGELQNGGGNRYGGSVMPYQPYDPVNVTIKSSTGGTITVSTTSFQPDN